jgi:acyl dehydratase
MNTRPCLAGMLLAALLAGCATGDQPPGTVVTEARFAQLVVPGQTTRAELLGQFGATKAVVFDSGMEAWLYTAHPQADGRHTEYVVLLDRQGIVRKVRTRPPYPSDAAEAKR